MNNMVMSVSIVNISKAILAAQKQMGAVVKDAKNPFFKSNFATLNAVREASNPQLNENGVSVLQPTVTYEGKNYVRTLLLHESGEYLGSDTEIVCAKTNDPQAQGSAISYSRRYGLQSLLGLAASDDDGEAAMNRSKEQQKPAVNYAPPKAAPTPVKVEATPVAQEEPKKSSFKAPKPEAAKELNWG